MILFYCFIFTLVVRFQVVLANSSECQGSGNASSVENGLGNRMSLESVVKTEEGGLILPRNFDLSPLPLPTEILDQLFGRRLFNTTMNYIVPMFHLLLPLHTHTGSTLHLAMQAFLGLFSAIAWISTIAIPYILTELQPLGLRKGRSLESPFKFKSLFSRDISNKVGLDWEPCLSKTICEAHRSPHKYPILALPFNFLFPASVDKEDIFKFGLTEGKGRRAAWEGVHSHQSCGGIYKCFFDVLDLMKYFYSLIT